MKFAILNLDLRRNQLCVIEAESEEEAAKYHASRFGAERPVAYPLKNWNETGPNYFAAPYSIFSSEVGDGQDTDGVCHVWSCPSLPVLYSHIRNWYLDSQLFTRHPDGLAQYTHTGRVFCDIFELPDGSIGDAVLVGTIELYQRKS